MHIRFRKAFGSYDHGKAYHLPEEIAIPYVKMGIAEVVDVVPVVVATAAPVETPSPEPQPDSSDEDKTTGSDDDDAPEHGRKKRSRK